MPQRREGEFSSSSLVKYHRSSPIAIADRCLVFLPVRGAGKWSRLIGTERAQQHQQSQTKQETLLCLDSVFFCTILNSPCLHHHRCASHHRCRLRDQCVAIPRLMRLRHYWKDEPTTIKTREGFGTNTTLTRLSALHHTLFHLTQ